MTARYRLGVLVAFLASLHGFLSCAEGQPPAAPDTKAAQAAAPAEGSAAPAEDFSQLMDEWKNVLGHLRELQIRYKVAKPEDRPKIEEDYAKLVTEGEAMAPRVVKANLEAYKAKPNSDREISQFLVSRLDTDFKADRYDEAYEIGSVLAENNFPNPAVYEYAGVSAFVLNDYDAAEKYLKLAQEKKAISDEGYIYLSELPKYRELWKTEQALRTAEAKSDDLPRVQFKTNKGDLVLELFENEAPNSVANFISLVDSGFYNGLTFHRVIRGFMAQGGDPEGNGSGGPDYAIACEVDKANARSHFAGTLSMAHGGKDTGGSQFFLTFRPTPHLNRKHTVFGRVIEGMNVLPQLKANQNGPDPDKIIEAKVLRKRQHPYKPDTLTKK